MLFSNTSNPKFPCKICAKNAHDKDKAVQCDLCEHWFHIKCNSLNYLDYRYLQTVMHPGTSCNVSARFFLLTPYHVKKNS